MWSEFCIRRQLCRRTRTVPVAQIALETSQYGGVFENTLQNNSPVVKYLITRLNAHARLCRGYQNFTITSSSKCLRSHIPLILTSLNYEVPFVYK